MNWGLEEEEESGEEEEEKGDWSGFERECHAISSTVGECVCI